MTDLASALASTLLTPFEGLDVVAVGVEIPGAAGGLQQAVKIDPQEFHQGDVVHIAMECVVAKVRHEPIVKEEPTGAQRRVHIFALAGMTIIDGKVVKDAIDRQRAAIAKAKEEAAGVKGLPGLGWGDDAEELLVEHKGGQHADGLREGCPSCDAEVAADDEG